MLKFNKLGLLYLSGESVMKIKAKNYFLTRTLMMCLFFITVFSNNAFSHCDTIEGPVVNDAKQALEKANADIVLKWVREQDEARLRKAFNVTLKKREQNPEDKNNIDMSFYEEAVKLHRVSEGVEYTGIKTGQIQVDPIIETADSAIAKGDSDLLVKMFPENVRKNIQSGFNKVMEKKKYMGESVAAGREYVASYIEFMHYIEKLRVDANAKNHKSGEENHHKH